MTREDARAFVTLHAGTAVSPALTDAEVEACLDQSRLRDAGGRFVGDVGYVETIWATRAVVLAYDVKLAKVAAKVDLSADGATINASQVTANLERLRRSWRSRCIPGASA
ncbi:hypothetical protein [Modestobacter sp. KNN46-3]|uniref:hypothetical protein n=1 Tax=Modestobacter sp. KNN46-3 TaxID=2711218 RepID=UPI0013E0BBA4|nr:hypothetical protein [Modestobacter sp. KNN46-3]